MQVKTLGLMDEKLNPLKWGDFQRPATPGSVLTTAGPPALSCLCGIGLSVRYMHACVTTWTGCGVCNIPKPQLW